MNTTQAIRHRRSTRAYSSKEVPVHTIRRLIELANLAPSPMNQQNRHFLVVRDESTRLALKDASLCQEHVESAPVVVVVVSRTGFITPTLLIERCESWGMDLWGARPHSYEENKVFLKHYRLWRTRWNLQDTAVAVQTLLLAATQMGLATCWVGGFDETAVKQATRLPDETVVHALVTLGYSLGEPDCPRERKDSDELIHWDRW